MIFIRAAIFPSCSIYRELRLQKTNTDPDPKVWISPQKKPHKENLTVAAAEQDLRALQNDQRFLAPICWPVVAPMHGQGSSKTARAPRVAFHVQQNKKIRGQVLRSLHVDGIRN